MLIIHVLSGCLAIPDAPTDTTTSTRTTQTCPPTVQTEWVSSEEVRQSNESVKAFDELSKVQQALFRRSYTNDSYEVDNVSETAVMELANRIVRYKNSTYRFHVIVC